MILTREDILLIMGKISPDGGWSDDPKIGPLQAKLSIMLEMAS